MQRPYEQGARRAMVKLALSDDASVAALHALGLTPIAMGADGITAPGRQWLLQPAGTALAAMAARPLGREAGGALGKALLSALNPALGRMGVTLDGQQLGALLGGAAASGTAAYVARKLGRKLTGDHWERQYVF